MKTLKAIFPIIFVITIIILLTGLTGAQECTNSTESNADCQQCHTCKVPTLHNTCLKDLPGSMVHQTEQHSTAEAPDTILLNQLVGLYPPICFNHKQHAEMAEMSDSCSVCHHYSPEGTIPPCRECHAIDTMTTTSDAPTLQDAYHQQCRTCHHDWNGRSTCQVCHKGAKGEVPEKIGMTDIDDDMPVVHVPISKVYATTMTASPIVTFQHVEHIELFQFRCTECHTHEKCSRCHNACTTSEAVNTGGVRVVCTCCHQDADPAEMSMTNADCRKCHGTEEKEPMFHEIVGQTMPDYLKNLNCESCHKGRTEKL